jgi:CotH kinase protein
MGCSGDDEAADSSVDEPAPGPDTTIPVAPTGEAPASLYDPAHVLEVEVQLEPADWQVLRSEGRSLFDVFQGRDAEYEYSEFIATVSVDGQRHEGVTVRKKGFLGSLSRLRPSLKLEFTTDIAGADAPGYRRLTLNNNRQDPSHARQCLAYGLFQRGGLAAPACNFAHVTVNGEDLGTYTNVEPIRKTFVARHFSSDAGNLYEGQLTDFVPEDVERFQLKTNEVANNRGDLVSLVEALEAPDAELVGRLEAAIDLDQFRDFWALETLVGHWDGYDGNRNNYYLYADPASGRLEFIPWGTDGAFAESSPGDALNATHTVYARGLIANRLYRLPSERERFRARLGELVDGIWDESELVTQLEGWTSRAPDAWPAATAELRRYIQTHAGQVRVELDQPAWEWIDAPEETSPCAGTLADVSMEFSTDYGDLAALNPVAGGFSVDLSMDGTPFEGAWFGRAGVDATATDPSVLVRSLAFLPDGRGVLLQISLPPAEFVPGARSLHALESFGIVLVLDGANTRVVGFVSDGTLQLDQAAQADGAPVSGRLEARLLQLGCAAL